ncbi:MAG: hypothetical protein AB7F94_05240 [Nitrospira sp.]
MATDCIPRATFEFYHHFYRLTGKDNTICAVPISGVRPYSIFKQIFDKFLEGK